MIGLYLISIANRILLLLARAPASSRLSAINLAHHLYGIADERRTHKMKVAEALELRKQLRDSQEKTELAVARGENMTMKILYLQTLVPLAYSTCDWMPKIVQLMFADTRPETWKWRFDAAREQSWRVNPKTIALEKQLEEARAERDAAREDAQKKTATIAERDERIASFEHRIACIEFHCQNA